MCGIAGIIDLSDKPIDSHSVRKMCDEMICRGPDQNGFKQKRHMLFGHRRLSILDLSTRGNQPMSTPDDKLCIVHNGEIYNHLDIRNKLTGVTDKYNSRTDTETILYGYKTWGNELTKYLRGMWAFAVWESTSKTLFLSRDRFGEKPLYYYITGKRLAFASTIAGLRPALLKSNLNLSAVASLLSYNYLPNNKSIYEGVQKLPPAHNLIFNKDGLHIECYWKLDYRQKIKITKHDAIDKIEELVDSAVQEQLVADVPVGVFLSGGVDSGYISALAAKHKPGITGITMTTPDSKWRDESENARQIAKKHGIKNIQIPLRDNCIMDLPFLLTKMEPFGDSSIIPVSAVSREAAKHFKVVLTGDGGDEVFGGYGLPKICYDAKLLEKGRYITFLKAISPALKFLSKQRLTTILRFLRLRSNDAKLLAGSGLISFLEARDSTPPQVKKLLYGSKLKPLIRNQLGNYLIENSQSGFANYMWDDMFYIGVKTHLVDDFLYKVDSASMHHSLETRTPFLDYRLIEFVAQLPSELLMHKTVYKNLLKEAATRYNSADIVYSQKKGFSIPVEKYFLKGWGKLLLNLTKNGIAAQMGLLNPYGIEKLLRKHGLRESQRQDKLLFTILALELWLRVFHEKSETPEVLAHRMISDVQH